MKNLFIVHLAPAIALLTVAGCVTPSSTRQISIQGESVVLAREEPGSLAFAPFHGPISVRSTYLEETSKTIHYEPSRDYILDASSGAIRRTPSSRIPDYSTNILYGREDFDHTKFPGYKNGPYFVFVDYIPNRKPVWPIQPAQTNFLTGTRQKLRDGKPVTIVAYGDSITAGGEATQPGLIYWQRWADELKRKYPAAQINAINGATGGDTTVNGLARLDDKVLKQHPDLVLVAFGMNDHNIPGFGVPVETFSKNLSIMIDRIRAGTQAEIILIPPFPPNPKWHFGSHNMEAYALATESVAREKQCAYADIYHNWVALSSKKKPEDLLGNNINHPNDFGHWIYFQVLNQLGL